MASPRRLLQRLDEELAGLGALAAAERILHSSSTLDALLSGSDLDRARVLIDAFEARALDGESRKKTGVFYTPPHVVDAMLDRVPLDGPILDPSSGAGAFLVEIARRLGPSVLDRLHACDISGEALDCAALALEAALGPGHRGAIREWRTRRAFRLDFLRDPYPGPAPALVVGNPPYGHGGGEDLAERFPVILGEVDLYACFVLRALDLVRRDGTVALLVPDTWLTNRNAAPFRRALVERAGLARLVDFGKPFASARDTRVHALVLGREADKCAVESERDGRLEPMASASRAALRQRAAAGWFLYRTDDEARACAALEANGVRAADAFEVIYGLRTGSNATHVAACDGDVPLVGGLDVAAFDRTWKPKSLVNPAAFTRAAGRQRGRWKVGIQRIRTNSRVSWRRWLEGAPVSSREVGLDSLTLVADRAPGETPSDALLCALGAINSSLLNRWYKLTFTDVNVKPTYIESLPLPRPTRALADAVRERMGKQGDLALERRIDRLVAEAFGLEREDVAVLERGFWGDELARRPIPD